MRNKINAKKVTYRVCFLENGDQNSLKNLSRNFHVSNHFFLLKEALLSYSLIPYEGVPNNNIFGFIGRHFYVPHKSESRPW